MMNTHDRTETVIIGGGQAGLAVGHFLAREERPFEILDANQHVGDNWRRHYDSLRLYNPARYGALPGLDFPGDPDHFPTRDEVADYLQDYADTFHLPVTTSTRVDEVTRVGDGYVVTAGERRIKADNVVATGTFGRPHTPEFAHELDHGIVQMHSSQYKNPSQLQPGRVLVVGASHSGADIAFELADHHDTVLAGRDTGELPFDIESRRALAVIWPILAFLARWVLTTSTPIGRKARPRIRSHGGPQPRHGSGELDSAGVERVTDRVTGMRDGKPVVGGDRVLDVANVIWATGFRQDFSWIRLPIVSDDGWPTEERGIVADAPGLFFMGLAFRHAFASMLLLGVGRDAKHVTDQILARPPQGPREHGRRTGVAS